MSGGGGGGMKRPGCKSAGSLGVDGRRIGGMEDRMRAGRRRLLKPPWMLSRVKVLQSRRMVEELEVQ